MAGGFSIVISATDNATARIDAINKRLAAIQAPAERMKKSLEKFGQLPGITKVGQGFERIGRGAYIAFQNIARVVSPLAAITGALSVAGMYRMVEAWGLWGSHLGFAAARIGLSAGQLQAFQGAALIAGASTGAMTSGLQALGQSMYDAIGGRAPETVALFNQLGIAFDDGTRHTRSLTAVLPELADKIAGIRDPYTQARVAAQLFGGSAEELLPFLRRGSAGIADLQERSRRYGVTNTAGVAAANRMREAQADLTLAVTGLGNSIAERVSPHLAKMLDWMANLIAANRGWIATGIGKYVGEFAEYIKSIKWNDVKSGLEEFAKKATAIADAFGGWHRVLSTIVEIKLAGWALSAIAPFTQVLQLLALVPGSGVTTAALAAVGIYAAASAGAGNARGAKGELLVGTQDDVRNSHPTSFGRWMYDKFDRLRQPDNYLWGTAANSTTNAPSAAVQAARSAQAMAYFQGKGWSRAEAAGMVANIAAESRFDPTAKGDSDLARGLGQWHPDRQQDFADLIGHDIRNSTFEEQLRFYDFELTSGKERGAGYRLRTSGSAFQAGSAVSAYDERPRDPTGNVAFSRGVLAQSIFDTAPASNSAQLMGRPGSTGRVDLNVHVTADGTPQVTARAKGNVNPPKVVTNGVGRDTMMGDLY